MSRPHDPAQAGEPGPPGYQQQPGWQQYDQQQYGSQQFQGQQYPDQQYPDQGYPGAPSAGRQGPAGSGRRKLVTIVVSAVVLVAIAVTVTLLLVNAGDDPPAARDDNTVITQVLTDFVAAAGAGDLTTAASLTCAAKQSGITEQGRPDGAIRLDKVENIMVDGDEATADVTLTLGGRTDTSTVRLVKEQSLWKQCGSDDSSDD